jgi:hypothetical protein
VEGNDHGISGDAARKLGWWRRWVVDPVVGQLKQGISPDKLGWTIGAGLTLGVFPILGTRAWLCLLAGWWFKLNQPVLHTFKSLAYPLHVAMIIPFIHLGQWMYGKEELRLSFEFLRTQFTADPWGFWQEFGWIILRAASAWLLVAPFILVSVKLVATPILRRVGVREKSAAS